MNQVVLDRNDDAGTAGLAVELAGHGQHGIADFLGVETPPREAPEQPIVGISCAGRGAVGRARRLAIGAAEQNQPMQRLETPTAGEKFIGQVVEQFGMAGRDCR